MNLLIVTQRVDNRDPVLGFFHGWIKEFAAQCGHVTVIAQCVGGYSLPSNVTVLSLGKERNRSKILQVLWYRWLLFRERKNYDAILVHMTPVWAVLGWWPALIARKNMYLWYEARGSRWPLKAAVRIVRKVFSASPYGMPIATPKSVIMGHGIDIQAFCPAPHPRDPKMLVSVGRITRSKHLDQIINAFLEFPLDYSLHLVGEARTEEDKAFQASLEDALVQYGLSHRVHIHPVTQVELPVILQTAHLFLHASTSGLDKALLEAMACECLVLSSSPAFQDLLPERCRTSVEGFGPAALKLCALSADSESQLRRELRGIIQEKHALPALIMRLVTEMQG